MLAERLIDLRGRVAVVTGGASGIGRGSAEMLASAGADVALLDIKAEEAAKAASEISSKYGVKAVGYKCDVMSEEEQERVVKAVAAELGTINILVNNTGGGGGGHEVFENLTTEYLNKIFTFNVYSIFRFSKLCLPYMRKSGYGSIINISSMASVASSVNMTVYASSKAAVNALTRQMAIDLAPVRVNAVAPGAIKTYALSTVLTEELEAHMLKSTPLKRLGKPEDIGSAVLFFASPMSEWVTGQTMIVSGGGMQTLD